MAVNVTANWRLIRSLDPLLRASGAGRLVFVTSGAAHKAKPYWGPYAVSKAALEAMALTYAAEVKENGVTVMIANPGPMRTRMRAQAMPGEDPMTLPAPEGFAKKCLPLLAPEWRETGRLYDFPTDRLMDFHPPG
jgi:NAD(P)-dependent dehydrogenase (short-subunit alcohol dehydrogenase family)